MRGVLNLNILIVDDEIIVNNGIILMLKKQNYYFDNIISATSGYEALNIIDTQNIDILLTDIKMPDFDGLKLAHHAKEKNPSIQIIFITGHSEFEFAKTAIDIGVLGYIVKPISDEIFYKTLDKAIYNYLQKDKISNLNTIEHALNHIFSSNMTSEATLSSYGSLFPSNCECRLAILKYRPDDEREAMESTKINQIISSIYHSIATENKLNNVFFTQYKNNQYDFMFLAFGTKNCAKLPTHVVEIKNSFENKTKHKLYALFSENHSKLCGNLYTKCYSAYDQRLFNPGETVFFFREYESAQILSKISNDIHLLESYIIASNTKETKITLNNILSFKDDASKYNLRLIFLVLANTIINTFQKKGLILSETELNDIFSCKILNTANKISDIPEFFYTLIKIHLFETTLSTKSIEAMMNKIKEYIEQKYSENINEKLICNLFSISPTYFSQLFKDKFGMTFINFLTEVRIKNACYLLKNTDIRISEISKQVGYSDAQYFHRVFKKIIGITPMQYRSNNNI